MLTVMQKITQPKVLLGLVAAFAVPTIALIRRRQNEAAHARLNRSFINAGQTKVANRLNSVLRKRPRLCKNALRIAEHFCGVSILFAD
jgi:hypothetical protein